MDEATIREKLTLLGEEHRDLDQAIMALLGGGPFDQLQVQRLKKRKLLLRDEIAKFENMLVPDIIA